LSHPLLDNERIADRPRPFLESIGEVFAIFGPPTQDSGNISYGVRVEDQRFFIKTTDPDIEAYCDSATRIELLYNAAMLNGNCDHPTLPTLHRIVESAQGPMLVYDWVDGELLRRKQDRTHSAHERFRQLPIDQILTVLDTIYELHDQLVSEGWIAVDFYDGCAMYNFDDQVVHIVDLDLYHRGPFTNRMGRLFGSTRFMAPEEFALGATIDERSTLFTMGRTAAIFLSDTSLQRPPFRGGDALYDVIVRACREDPHERYPSMNEFHTAWQEARNH